MFLEAGFLISPNKGLIMLYIQGIKEGLISAS